MHQDSLYSRLKSRVVKSKDIMVTNPGTEGVAGSIADSYLGTASKSRSIVYKRPMGLPVVSEQNGVSTFDKSRVVEPFSESTLANHPESKSFIATALAWQGSVTPRVLPRVAVTAAYATAVYFASTFVPAFSMPVTPFEYSGAVLALLLVLRVNAGHDRWWEARKIWGAIVNQSRNLALVVYGYSEKKDENVTAGLRWIAAWPHVMRESLRKENSLAEVAALVGKEQADRVRNAENMSMYVGLKITEVLLKLRSQGLDSFAFLRAETERSQLIDAIGACERIRNTRMPLVLAIKTRRFIFLFLLLLPLALVDRAGWLTPLIVALASYPLFSLDEIGAELQNPFSARNLSHLPLDGICRNIAGNVMGLLRV